MRCEKCGNEDIKYFFLNKNQYYCRKCISFKGEKASIYNIEKTKCEVKLDYQLSPDQLRIQNQVLNAFKNHQNILIHAVCGAGKTELVYKVISYALENGNQVGFAIPRKDVVIDLFPRLKEAFKTRKVIAVYGEHHNELQGDIILLTTHQLFRYERYFDLLIIDETDAFPFYGNETLNSFFEKSIKGNYVMLSATPLDEMIKKIKETNGVYLTLFKRYHNHPLPVPKIKIRPFIQKIVIIDMLKKYQQEKKPVLVFAPTIDKCENLYFSIKYFIKNGDYVHSKKKDRDELISNFKKGKIDYLITTSILERGVTIKNLQVIIYCSNHVIYDAKTLIQIAGRVGRKIDAFEGDVIFLCDYVSKDMEDAIKKIEMANRS